MPNQHSKRPPRSRPFSLRVTDDEYADMKAKADKAKQTVTDYARIKLGFRPEEAPCEPSP
jgi:hypothetical protein